MSCPAMKPYVDGVLAYVAANYRRAGVYRVLRSEPCPDFPGAGRTLVWLSPDGIEAPDADVLVVLMNKEYWTAAKSRRESVSQLALWRDSLWTVDSGCCHCTAGTAHECDYTPLALIQCRPSSFLHPAR